jgi:hypothetical protein
LEQVKYLIETMNIRVNQPDGHDATPLYLAALTGRNEICRFLLERGARCDPDSGGDAARVFYVALTPELRKLLGEWSLSAATRDPYLDLLRKTFTDSTHADCFVVLQQRQQGERTYLHRALLHARCPRLMDLLVPSLYGDLDELRIPAEYLKDAQLLHSILEYLYTGRLEIRDVERAVLAGKFAIEVSLDLLFERLQSAVAKYEASSSSERFFCSISDGDSVRSDMARLATLVCESENISQWSDFKLRYQDCTWSLHACLLCAQSEYLSCALTGGFRESQEASMDLTHLAPNASVVELCIQWMYADSFAHIPSVGLAVQLLEFGSAILCDRLLLYTANTALVPSVDVDNVFDMLELALAYNLERLETKCVEVISFNLELVHDSTELQQVFLKEIAVTAQDALITDVPIAAEIRSNIKKALDVDQFPQERFQMLDLLQGALDRAMSASIESPDTGGEEKKA